jgi:hypothetical protein
MNRSRSELRKEALAEFQAYCEMFGWVAQECKGDYEELRMRHPDVAEPLIVHKRLKTASGNVPNYLTTWGQSQRMATEYIRDRDKAK